MIHKLLNSTCELLPLATINWGWTSLYSSQQRVLYACTDMPPCCNLTLELKHTHYNFYYEFQYKSKPMTGVTTTSPYKVAVKGVLLANSDAHNLTNRSSSLGHLCFLW